MKKIITLMFLIFSFHNHGMLMKLSCKGIKPASNTKQFMKQTVFNSNEINLDAFQKISVLEAKIKILEEQLSLQKKVEQTLFPSTNGCVKEEMILFQSNDQRSTNEQ